MAAARLDPEQYDLLRVRMGGWSEYFISMFPDHQQQHQHRPISVPDGSPTPADQARPDLVRSRGDA